MAHVFGRRCIAASTNSADGNTGAERDSALANVLSTERHAACGHTGAAGCATDALVHAARARVLAASADGSSAVVFTAPAFVTAAVISTGTGTGVASTGRDAAAQRAAPTIEFRFVR